MTTTQVVVFRYSVQFRCSVVSDSATPWTAAHQASLSIVNSPSLLKLKSTQLVTPSNHLILSSPSPLPFDLSQHESSNTQVLEKCIFWLSDVQTLSCHSLPPNISPF